MLSVVLHLNIDNCALFRAFGERLLTVRRVGFCEHVVIATAVVLAYCYRDNKRTTRGQPLDIQPVDFIEIPERSRRRHRGNLPFAVSHVYGRDLKRLSYRSVTLL